MLSSADFDLLFGNTAVRPEPTIRARPAIAAKPARRAVKIGRPSRQDR